MRLRWRWAQGPELNFCRSKNVAHQQEKPEPQESTTAPAPVAEAVPADGCLGGVCPRSHSTLNRPTCLRITWTYNQFSGTANPLSRSVWVLGIPFQSLSSSCSWLAFTMPSVCSHAKVHASSVSVVPRDIYWKIPDGATTHQPSRVPTHPVAFKFLAYESIHLTT